MCLPTQERIWTLSKQVGQWDVVVDTQVGMNNLLVLFDSSKADPEALASRLLESWRKVEPGGPQGKLLEVGVVYGGDRGMDLGELAAHHGIDPETVVKLHSTPEYVVFAPSTTPGFGYLFGLDPRLFTPRRKVPVVRPFGGNVTIGGGQSNLGNPRGAGGPPTFPTGWYVIGHVPEAPVPFDLSRNPPNLLDVGDRIRFRVERIER